MMKKLFALLVLAPLAANAQSPPYKFDKTDQPPGTVIYAKGYGVKADGATSDDVALKKAADACNTVGGHLILPAGTIKLDGTGGNSVTLSGCWMQGAGGTPAKPYSTASGTRFNITSTSVIPFLIGSGTTVSDASFFYPNQTTGTTVYPALFGNTVTSGFVHTTFDRITVVNAYDGWVQSIASGDTKISNSNIWVHHYAFKIYGTGDSWTFSNVRFTPGPYIDALCPSIQATCYATVNAGTAVNAIFDIPSGNGVTVSMNSIETFGWRYAFLVESGGSMFASQINVTWDGIGTLVDTSSGGTWNKSNVMTGSMSTCGIVTYGGSPVIGGNPPCFNLGSNSGLTLNGMDWLGARGSFIVTTAGSQNIFIRGLTISGGIGQAADGSEYYFIDDFGGGDKIFVSNSRLFGRTADAHVHGILFRNANPFSAGNFALNGNSFDSFNDILSLNSSAQYQLSNNVSTNSLTSTLTLSGAGGVVYSGNSWDIAPVSLSRNTAGNTFAVTDYGAKCNGTTDDHAAWQSAWNALVAYSFQTGTFLAAKLVGCQSGQSLITTTLDFTKLSSFSQPYGLGVTVDMTGTCLIGKTSGTPVIDMVASRFINFEHLCIYGSATSTPSVGLMLGRNIAANGADAHHFNRPVITGFFTLASWLNFGSEDLTLVEPVIWNSQASGTTYAMIQDGLNHFDVCSKTVATGCTLPTDTNQSFGNNIVIGGWIGATPSNGTPYWVGSASHHQFYGGYMSTSGVNCGVLYNVGANQISNLYFDLHCETTAITDTFLVSGTNTTPFFIGFYFNDRLNSSSNSVFKLDTGLTLATCDGCNIHIDQFNAGAGVKLFDTAANWNYGGDIYLPATGNYTAPATFSGSLCIANVCDNYRNPGGSVTNTAVGNGAAKVMTSALNSTAFGSQACAADISGNQCVAFGGNAGASVTATAAGAFFGFDAGQFVQTGLANVAVGNLAMTGTAGAKVTGNNNTAIGASSLTALQTSGNANTAVGNATGAAITTGGSNTCIGNAVCSTVLTTASGSIYIGVSNNPAATNTSNVLQIAGLSPGIAVLSATGLNTASPLLSHPADVRTGTKFTAAGTGACATITTTLGGASAGSFLCTGTAGASTATITIAGATGNTATNGWACVGGDATSGVAWSPSGAASTTTGTMSGAIATTSDRVVFTCTGY